MPLRCIIVVLFKQIGTKNVANIRMLHTTQKCRNHSGKHVPPNHLDKTIIHRYRNLVYNPNKVQATYVWIDGTGENIRIKDRILDKVPNSPADVPTWSYAENSPYPLGPNSENILCPRAIYRDPFKPGEQDVLVMCDTYKSDGSSPSDTNHRYNMQITVDKTKAQEPMFGIEQKYTLLHTDGHPFGWPKYGYPESNGMYYCGVGSDRVYARDLVESHSIACIYAGINFEGTNAEVIPSQWEYRIGPAFGMKAADDLWVSRYILSRITEEFGIQVTFHSKPINGNWNETRAHINYSTAAMRADGGMKSIMEAIERLAHKHEKDIKAYDPHFREHNDTTIVNSFTWGIADRGVSIRVPELVIELGKGFLEDRRPPSNMDPYAVCNALLTTTLLNE